MDNKVKILNIGETNEKPIFDNFTNKYMKNLSQIFKIEHYPNGYLIPQLGIDKWDGHIYVSGATGAGKSYLIKQIVNNDVMKRYIIIYSDVAADPSFKELFESGRAFTIEQAKELESKGVDEFTDIFRNKIVIFDDCTKPDCIETRDHLLEKGRHSNTLIICVNHKLRDWQATKKPLNESKYIVMFPSANKMAVVNFLDGMGFKKETIRDIVNLSNSEGRYLIFHQFNPNLLFTTQTILYI